MIQNGLDAERYIESEGAKEKIAPVFLPILKETIALLKSSFQAKLHGIYLYGSVATGQAVLRQSDIDIFVIFADSMSDMDHAEIKLVAQTLFTTYHALVREVGIATVPLQEALAKESLPGLGCFIKHLCICVEGEDIRPLLPKFRPSVEVARGFNGDYTAVIQTKLDELTKTNQVTITQALIRQICRKTVRTGFSLVMQRMGCWTTGLNSSFDYFCRYYPEKRDSMELIHNWTLKPPEDHTKFLDTVTPFSEWLTTEFDRVIGK